MPPGPPSSPATSTPRPLPDDATHDDTIKAVIQPLVVFERTALVAVSTALLDTSDVLGPSAGPRALRRYPWWEGVNAIMCQQIFCDADQAITN